MKKILFLIFVSFSFLYPQSYKTNTVGILDISEVYQSFYSDSEDARELDRLKLEYKQELDKKISELDELSKKKFDADKNKDDQLSQELANQIKSLVNYINEYKRVKKIEIDKKKEGLRKGDKFFRALNVAIENIAKQKGISSVLSKDNPYLVWWSTSSEITRDVIKYLKTYYK